MSKLHDTWTVQHHGDLVAVADGILTVQGSLHMPLGEFPRRMTVVALAAGGSVSDPAALAMQLRAQHPASWLAAGLAIA